MKRAETFRIALISFVFVILLSSSALSGIFIMILYTLNFSPSVIAKPIFFSFAPIITSVVIGTLISSIISNRVLDPLNTLIHATRKIAKGDFSVEVPVDETFCAGGEVYELLSSFNDMTKELASIEIFRNDFINEFSHEFKTPIISIRGFAKQLQKGDLSDEQKKEYINIIVSEADRLANMSSNILLLSKYETQNIITDKTDFFLDEQIRRDILLLEKQWTNKNINLNIFLDETLYHGNEEMISHIWINLLSNAIKFNKEYGELTIKCHKSLEHVLVTISDTGIGMTKEVQEKIFTKFYQGDSSHASQGNGLGLSLVKRICTLCGGTIEIESTPDIGTSFRIKLPLD